VAVLRTASARYPDDAGIRHLIDRLRAASSEFRGLWADQDVRVRRSTHKRLNHPLVGWLDLKCKALHDPDRDQWIVFYTASPGGASVEALRLLKAIGTRDTQIETSR
jgi:hypothetical protein